MELTSIGGHKNSQWSFVDLDVGCHEFLGYKWAERKRNERGVEDLRCAVLAGLGWGPCCFGLLEQGGGEGGVEMDIFW